MTFAIPVSCTDQWLIVWVNEQRDLFFLAEQTATFYVLHSQEMKNKREKIKIENEVTIIVSVASNGQRNRNKERTVNVLNERTVKSKARETTI